MLRTFATCKRPGRVPLGSRIVAAQEASSLRAWAVDEKGSVAWTVMVKRGSPVVGLLSGGHGCGSLRAGARTSRGACVT
jgi:hypothetical protein